MREDIVWFAKRIVLITPPIHSSPCEQARPTPHTMGRSIGGRKQSCAFSLPASAPMPINLRGTRRIHRPYAGSNDQRCILCVALAPEVRNQGPVTKPGRFCPESGHEFPAPIQPLPAIIEDLIPARDQPRCSPSPKAPLSYEVPHLMSSYVPVSRIDRKSYSEIKPMTA